MISKGFKSEEYIDISQIKEADIASYYLGIKSIPCVISSPLRIDRKPSFSLFSSDGEKVGFLDYSTREHGSIIDLLMQLWNCSYYEAKKRIYKDLNSNKTNTPIYCSINKERHYSKNNINLKCKIREWQNYDINYWESFGISLNWLKFANVYPISHKIIIKDDSTYTFKADKYAYAFVEFKEGKVTLKIYQPFNTYGYKWSNNHDKSVISLWTKIPKQGDKVCICSSLKDALCLWANTSIPSIAVQGEGYNMSNTAINNLKDRFNKVYILFDNDKAGLANGKRLSALTNFTNIILPPFEGGKDISDFMKLYGKEIFLKTIIPLFNN